MAVPNHIGDPDRSIDRQIYSTVYDQQTTLDDKQQLYKHPPQSATQVIVLVAKDSSSAA